jgi:hypothetical protein
MEIPTAAGRARCAIPSFAVGYRYTLRFFSGEIDRGDRQKTVRIDVECHLKSVSERVSNFKTTSERPVVTDYNTNASGYSPLFGERLEELEESETTRNHLSACCRE